MLGAPADSMNTSLGMGLTIALTAGGGMPGWQWSEHRRLKPEALGLIPGGCHGFFSRKGCVFEEQAGVD